ncbi:MAG: hypothetical protein GXY77_14685 [Fibrobacter sp.]|nr:hypothetical protein [Fibrobacter sp.]
MKMMVLAALLVIVGCGKPQMSTISEEEMERAIEKIPVLYTSPYQYEVLGVVAGYSPRGSMSNIMSELKEGAYKLGADAVLISDSSSGFKTGMQGTAIKYKK